MSCDIHAMKTTTVPGAARQPGRQVSFPEDRCHRAAYRDAAPAVCTGCHALFQHGHWAWSPAPAEAREVLCPACERVRDQRPAAYLTLDGRLARHEHDEVMRLLRETEQRERAVHAMERIMDITHWPDQVHVSTTAAHLVQSLAQAITRRFGGRAAFSYDADQHVLRAHWKRMGARPPC
jgi:hypothetical protein